MTPPLDNWFSLPRGYRNGQRTWYGTAHRGVDVIVPKGTPVYAPEKGFVAYHNDSGGGMWVIIISGTRRHWFAHLSSRPVSVGTNVKERQLIAFSGNTGVLTTAPHLHYQVMENGAWIDPEPLFTTNTVEMALKKQAEAKFFVVPGRADRDGKEYIYAAEPNGFPHYVPNQVLLDMVQHLVGRPPVQLGQPVVMASEVTGNKDDDWMFDIKIS